MKFTVFSDLHIHNYKKYDHDGSRLDNTLDVLTDIFKYNDEHGIGLILFPGDLYDQQKSLPTVVINKTIDRLRELFDTYPDQDIIAISGNHDHATKNLKEKPSETALSHLNDVFESRFVLIDEVVYPDRVGVHVVGAGVHIFGIPYFEYKEHFLSELASINEHANKVPKDRQKILMIHQTPKNSNPNIPFDFDVEGGLFHGWDLVLCGHIHKREQLKPNFLIVGSPLHRDLGDEGEDKGFLVFDTNDLTKHTFIHLDKYPVFKRSTTDDPEDADYVVPIIELDNDSENENVDFEKFTTDNDRSTLITNYWQEVEGKDKELLQLGLKFIP